MTARIYDSREQIGCGEFPHHQIGVLASEYISNHVDIETHVPALWSGAAGTVLPPGEDWRAKAAENTRHVIARIDAVIEELQRHRARLVGEAKKLEAGEA